MSDVTITTGDDVDFLHQVNIDGVGLAISAGATVTSRIVSDDRAVNLTDTITGLIGSQGADWPNGLIGLPYPSAITAAIIANASAGNVNFIRGRLKAIVETEILDGGKKTTGFDTIFVFKGSI